MFSAISKVILDERFKVIKARAIFEVLGERLTQDFCIMVGTQTKSVSIFKTDPVQEKEALDRVEKLWKIE